jgi:alkylation response protein AidB-like acyl-CoA dehydrogenase
MDFRFTEEQVMFRDVVRDFLDRECTPKDVRALSEGGEEGLAGLRAKLAELGLAGLALPEAHGGLGLSEIDAVQAAEECGHAALPLAHFENVAVAAPLLGALPGSAAGALALDLLPRVVAGEAVVAFGHSINPFVFDAGTADLVLTAADGAVHGVPRAAAMATQVPSIDETRRRGRISWSGSPETWLAEMAQAQDSWDLAFDRAVLYTAADMIGAADRMLSMAVQYAGERQQFGRPIGSFQAVKHMLADVQVKLTFARPVVYYAAYAIAHRLPDRAVRVSHAKVAAGEAALLAARRTLQAHGAIGYTYEYDLQLWMKRVWADEAAWGNSAWHRARIADAVLAPNADLGPGRTWGA